MQKTTFQQNKKYFNLSDKTRKEYDNKRKKICDNVINFHLTYTFLFLKVLGLIVIASIFADLFYLFYFIDFFPTIILITKTLILLYFITFPIFTWLDALSFFKLHKKSKKELLELRQKYLGK